jgi:hydrogenase maturation protein HypF
MEHAAIKIVVNGIVQGVGFRPFVFNLANHHGLKGEVANTSSGVVILVEGSADHLNAFAADLTAKAPPLAHIVDVTRQAVTPSGYSAFTIIQSVGGGVMSTLISPDVSICDDCRKELFDPNDRRYHYPFINCTNCGPRYTIIDDIPYDRPKTSMRHFVLCPHCRAEYEDPANRRFHAQPNACAACGPGVTLFDNKRQRIDHIDPIKKVATLLKKGCIVAVKGLGGFHLAADAENGETVVILRARKQREEKPLALMSPNLSAIRRYAHITDDERLLLTAIQRPIVLLGKKEPNTIAANIAPGNRTFGVMLPYTPLHYLLLEHGFTALVMTSGNLTEEPIAIDNTDAFNRLADIADYFLVHNRDIYLRSDDSIVRRAVGATRYLRRSRGYVPVPIFLERSAPVVLAVGAEIKNTVCLTKGKMAFLSQHIGDLENLATGEFFEKTIRHMQRILKIAPEIIAYDMHPDYLSSRWALDQRGIRKVAVQHHHAHVVSAMAENRISGTVIGLSFDGTGYGTDGHIWGGEVLLADERSFERAAHLVYMPMPGSAFAIKQPWRMGLSYLYAAYGNDFANLSLPFLDRIAPTRMTIILNMIRKRVNTPLTSSLGRLFDGVAAILGLRDEVAFEGQAAMELEMIADTSVVDAYDVNWEPGYPIQIPPVPIIRCVVDDLLQETPLPNISGRFHMTLVKLFSDICEGLRRERGLARVVLSGGVFQNVIMLRGLMRSLEGRGFEVYSHTQVPTNDGGICLGQAVIAAAQTAASARNDAASATRLADDMTRN